MQIAQVLAGYSLGGADLLRRAMGKKKAEEMAKQRQIFMEGAVGRGVEAETATYIFDLMEKFAGYGFNKSHSAAYALVSYHTMWLKAHYPAAFMAAVLSSDMDNTDKVVTFIEECRTLGLKVEPPRVNRSEYRFTVDGDNIVIYGLGAIKGVGESAIESLLAARQADGPYQDLFEFCRRIDLRKANKRVLEALVRAGALDELGPNRATLIAHLPLALQMAEQHHAAEEAGQADLFGLADPEPAAADDPADPQVLPEPQPDWDDEVRLQGEKETLGLYLTGHPIDRYERELRELGITRISDLDAEEGPGKVDGKRRRGGRKCMVAGLAVAVSRRKTQRGRMASVLLDDRSGRIEANLFGEAFEANQDQLANDRVLVISGSVQFDEYRGGLSLRADHVMELQKARELYARQLSLVLDARGREAQLANGWLEDFKQLLQAYNGGNCPLRLHYRCAGAEGSFDLGQDWRITPADELLRRLERLPGIQGLEMSFRRPSLPE